MTTSDLRKKYIEFFQKKRHALIPSASLIPDNDPSALFISAGMHPLVPYLRGEKHPAGNRLVDCQKCLRTGDIDEAGDNRHLTFFEMLGNWSLGNYFKEEAIDWSWEFITSKDCLGLDPKRIYVTVFAGDLKDNTGRDEDSIKFWQKWFEKAGISAGVSLEGTWDNEDVRIFALGNDDNWWGLGNGGPCGPCTEMFYDLKPENKFERKKSFSRLVNDGRFFEFWNDVFMEFNRKPDGSLEKLKQRNVDTGMGLERTTAALNGFQTVFDIDEFQMLFKKLEELSGEKYADHQKEFRVICDHLRAATFILGDDKGIEPSNVEQGYVLRRLIRRAIRFGKIIGINEVFAFKVAEVVIDQMQDVYPELKKNSEFVLNQLKLEEEKFANTLERGLKQFQIASARINSDDPKVITGEQSFDLFQSYGFPIEMTKELAQEQGLTVDDAGFYVEFKKHQDLSRAGAAQKFKGGLADASVETTRLHTATHLLQAALRKVLGEHVFQKGSNITTERLRFDFTHKEKMTAEQIKSVEDMVNEWIKLDLPVICEELSYDKAKEAGIMGLFEDKYGAVVKVYGIGDVSKEMCGGPHATHTAELGHFKILKEEASSSGVRRIKAVLEK